VAKLTISDAARVASVSRVTLHRYIKSGSRVLVLTVSLIPWSCSVSGWCYSLIQCFSLYLGFV
jgi:hypothetical protein